MFDLDTPEGMALAKQWTEMLISTINQNGVWIVPRSWAVIRLDKEKKIARVEMVVEPDRAIVRVLEAMGWTVENRSALFGPDPSHN